MIHNYIKLLEIYLSQMKKYNIIIIGAGCSGLSLAYRLLDTNIKVCILESGSKNNRIRKTWSYWDIYNHPFIDLEGNSLENIYCLNNLSSIKLNCKDYNYKSIDSNVFDEYIFDKINKSKNIDIFFNSSANNIVQEDSLVHIESEIDTFVANEVYDSSPDNIDSPMYQVFLGYFINPNSTVEVIPKLMDFTGDDEFSFYYVIPFRDGSCLVEYTFFTPVIKTSDELKKNLDRYIKNIVGQYTLARSEYGVIPMSPKLPDTETIPNVYKIGIRSGATRASTGYTFINIQKQSDYLIRKIKNLHSINPLLTTKSKILRKMDSILLRIIKNEPKKAKNIIFNMFSLNNHQTIIRFLSDIPSIFDILKIIINMPKIIFIKYALKSLINRKI